jgi:hypothetical protein
MIPHRRDGFGAVTMVVLVVVLLLLPFSLALSDRSRGLTSLLGRVDASGRAGELAELALQEAVHLVRVEANTPGSPVFDFLRSANGGEEIGLAPEALRFTEEELSLVPGTALAGPVMVRAVRWAYASRDEAQTTDYDLYGVLRLSARVTTADGGSALRELDHGVRVSLTAPVRPFDRTTFLLADATPLLRRGSLGGDANAAIRLAAERIPEWRQALERDLEHFRRYRDRHPRAPELLDPIVEAFEATLTRVPTPDRYWKVLGTSTPSHEVERAVHLFHEDLAIYSTAPVIDLATLDLPTRVEPVTREVEAANEATRLLDEERVRVGQRIMDAIDARDLGGIQGQLPEYHDVHRQYLASVERLVRALGTLLETYKTFQDAIQEVGGDDARFLVGRFGRLTEEELRAKAHYLFEGPQAAERATHFLHTDPPPRGLVYVDNRDIPLELELQGVEGSLVIATSGEILVRRATVAELERDTLTLVSQRHVSVRGPMHAAVLLPTGTAEFGDEQSGSLILRELFGETARVLRGVVRRQARLETSPGNPGGTRAPPRPETLHVTLDPYPLYRKESR